jgi:hypothetical protein
LHLTILNLVVISTPVTYALVARNVFDVSLRLLSMPSIKSTAWPDYNALIVFSGKHKFLGGDKRHESQ